QPGRRRLRTRLRHAVDPDTAAGHRRARLAALDSPLATAFRCPSFNVFLSIYCIISYTARSNFAHKHTPRLHEEITAAPRRLVHHCWAGAGRRPRMAALQKTGRKAAPRQVL